MIPETTTTPDSRNLFQQSLLNPDEFTITYELVPGQAAAGRRVGRLLEFAGQAGKDGRIKALSITDNAGGSSALAPVALGAEIQKIGIEPLIHFSLKDKNRDQLGSHIFLYHRRNFHSLLILGGDFPKQNYYGQAKPVFDLDSVQTLQLFQDMREGIFSGRMEDEETRDLREMRFFRGCVVSPFKTTEAEQIWQYEKLKCKVAAGADFIITQLGYDVRKFDELIRYCRQNNINIPLLGNVFIPSLGVARYMKRGGVPGVLLPEKFVVAMENESRAPDHGEKARLIRAATLIAILRKQGYAGVHLGGNLLDFEKISFVLDEAEIFFQNQRELRADIHFPVSKSWYYFEPGPDLELNNDIPTALNPTRKIKPMYFFNATMHNLLFAETSWFAYVFGRFCLFCARGIKTTLLLTRFERIIKAALFSCRMCGDCTLTESNYLCPQSGCPKKLLNGPCGGSRFGTCEVYPERRCFYVQVYDRMPQQKRMTPKGCLRKILPPKDWSRDQTSSWITYFKLFFKL